MINSYTEFETLKVSTSVTWNWEQSIKAPHFIIGESLSRDLLIQVAYFVYTSGKSNGGQREILILSQNCNCFCYGRFFLFWRESVTTGRPFKPSAYFSEKHTST
jgi:hypothetical protein